MTLFCVAEKFSKKLGFYRTKIIQSEPEFRLGTLVLDNKALKNSSQFSFWQVGEFNSDESGILYECEPRNLTLLYNNNLHDYFPSDFPWLKQGRKNEFFDADSLLQINSMKQILDLYRGLFR